MHLGQNAQPHIYPLNVHLYGSERILRAREVITGKGQREPSGRRKSEQPYVVGDLIKIINNVCRPEHAATFLPVHRWSFSAREDLPGRGENLGQKTERTLGRRKRRAAACHLKN